MLIVNTRKSKYTVLYPREKNIKNIQTWFIKDEKGKLVPIYNNNICIGIASTIVLLSHNLHTAFAICIPRHSSRS